jgi:hypothetical protein
MLDFKEINGPLEFMGPVSLRCDLTLPRIDLNYGTSRDHGVQGQIEFADDSQPIWRVGGRTLSREQSGLAARASGRQLGCVPAGNLIEDERPLVFWIKGAYESICRDAVSPGRKQKGY